MDYKYGISEQNYYSIEGYRQYKINLSAIKSMDDMIEIFKVLDIRIGFYEGSQTKSVQELIVKNNPHLFEEIKK